MSDLPNPIEDTYGAVKSRLGGPMGTFILVWGISHPKVLAFIFFDATGNSGSPQASVKIQKISELISTETGWEILWRPLAWTIFVMLTYQCISLVWHLISEQFKYLQERITLKKDLRIFLFRRFSKNPDDLMANIRGEVLRVHKLLSDFPNIGNSISAINTPTKNEAILTEMLRKAKDGETVLQDTVQLITLANESPLMDLFRKFRK